MPRIQIAKAFRRHVECPDMTVGGTTVREALDLYFEAFPAVRGYVLDERGAVRFDRHPQGSFEYDLEAVRVVMSAS